MGEYRPWGLIDWVLQRIPARNWAFLGCLSTGERSLAALRILKNEGYLGEYILLQIANNPSRFDDDIRKREENRLEEFKSLGGDEKFIQRHVLLESPAAIVGALDAFLPVAGPNLILDVSTLPKRFFFPLLKMLLRRTAEIQNLVVTYTSPVGYTQDKLAENYDQWDHLPLFSGSYENAKPEVIVINVGFEVFGLQDQVEQGAGLPIKLLFPFPAAPQAFRRSWDLVRRLQKHRSTDAFQLYRTDPKDVSDAFDRIVSITDNGSRKVLLAPFGPKPISVAMCIFASLTESQVFYSQPTVYHPQYSYGVGTVGTSDAVWAYVLRLNGRNCYNI